MIPTQDHTLIQQWAVRHNASPAEINRRKHDGEPAILTFVIGNSHAVEPDIYPIPWESFFAQFDVLKLSMAFDEQTPRFDIVRVKNSAASSMAH